MESMDAMIVGSDPADVIKDSDTASFGADVIEASQETPVIVDFWAPWCGPCKTLGPQLEAAVTAAGGAVKMVKVNVDENQQLAAQLRIQSIPTVYAFFKGQPVDGFMGAVPESQIKDFVKKLASQGGGSPLDAAMEEALTAFDAGDFAAAGNMFSQVLQADGGHVEAMAGLLQCFIQQGELETAKEILGNLDAKMAEHQAVRAAAAALQLAEQAENTGDLEPLFAAVEADPKDHDSRLELAKSLAAVNRRDEAADQLLESIRLDREWNDAAARKQLLSFFEAWGAMDEASVEARRKLSALLFS